jgi:hypothetical protein
VHGEYDDDVCVIHIIVINNNVNIALLLLYLLLLFIKYIVYLLGNECIDAIFDYLY